MVSTRTSRLANSTIHPHPPSGAFGWPWTLVWPPSELGASAAPSVFGSPESRLSVLNRVSFTPWASCVRCRGLQSLWCPLLCAEVWLHPSASSPVICPGASGYPAPPAAGEEQAGYGWSDIMHTIEKYRILHYSIHELHSMAIGRYNGTKLITQSKVLTTST